MISVFHPSSWGYSHSKRNDSIDEAALLNSQSYDARNSSVQEIMKACADQEQENRLQIIMLRSTVEDGKNTIMGHIVFGGGCPEDV